MALTCTTRLLWSGWWVTYCTNQGNWFWEMNWGYFPWSKNISFTFFFTFSFFWTYHEKSIDPTWLFRLRQFKLDCVSELLEHQVTQNRIQRKTFSGRISYNIFQMCWIHTKHRKHKTIFSKVLFRVGFRKRKLRPKGHLNGGKHGKFTIKLNNPGKASNLKDLFLSSRRCLLILMTIF